MPRPSSNNAAPNITSMREKFTTYQQACKLVADLSLDVHAMRTRVFTNDDRAALTIIRGKLRKVQRWLEEGI